MIRKWIKEKKDSWILKKSNWGRDYGWYIIYEDEIIGELVDCQWKDMFWDSYILKSTNEKYNQLLINPKSWESFKYKNKYYDQYVESPLTGGWPRDKNTGERFIEINKRVSMRGLYLTEITDQKRK